MILYELPKVKMKHSAEQKYFCKKMLAHPALKQQMDVSVV